jgi:abequosyltransferase
MSRRPKLSIAIPTFNRTQMLREAIQSIVIASKGVENQIEILISDNGGLAENQTLCEEFKQSGIPFRYSKNETNIGMEPNILKALDLASGEYVWVFSDDDRMAPDAIEKVLERVFAGHDLIVTNFSIWDRSFKERRADWNFAIFEDRVFTNPSEVLGTFSCHFGYISCIVMKKSSLEDVSLEERNQFIGTGFSWIYSIYAGLLKHCSVAFISKSVVFNRSDNSTSYDWHHYFVTGTARVFRALKARGYPARAVRVANRRVLLDFVLYNLIGLRFEKIRRPGVLKLLFKAYSNEWIFWFACVPILILPFFILKMNRDVVIRLPQIIKRRRPTVLAVE